MNKIILTMMLGAYYLQASPIDYKCIQYQSYDHITGVTTTRTTNQPSLVLKLTVSSNKIFDGTYNYAYSKNEISKGIEFKKYINATSGDAILFSTKPAGDSNGIPIYSVNSLAKKTDLGLACVDYSKLKR
jgi:hypothetical protein